MWMSYGANASAGLRNAKGSMALLIEAGKPGIFPQKLGEYPRDDPLGAGLRFNHGERGTDPRLAGKDFAVQGHHVRSSAPALNYQAHQRIHIGFTDGHAERFHFEQVLRRDSAMWLGTGRGSDDVFD